MYILFINAPVNVTNINLRLYLSKCGSHILSGRIGEGGSSGGSGELINGKEILFKFSELLLAVCIRLTLKNTMN